MIIAFLVGMVTSLVTALFLRKLARRYRAGKKAGRPRVAGGHIPPPVGGLAIVLGCLAGLLAWSCQVSLPWPEQWPWLAGAVYVIFMLGLIDDFMSELSPWQKLLGQCVGGLMLVRGGIATQIVFLPEWVNVVVSLIWILTIINAFNLLDIADGLAGGVSFIAAGTLVILSLESGQTAHTVLLMILCGAILGVLVFNFRQATLFLGDSGSMLLGFILSALTLAISYAPMGREIALVIPILVLGLPLFDLAFVVIIRRLNGRSPIRKSRDHFALRLIRQGLTPTKAVLAMYMLCLLFSFTALLIARVSNRTGALVLGVVVALSLAWAFKMARVKMDGDVVKAAKGA